MSAVPPSGTETVVLTVKKSNVGSCTDWPQTGLPANSAANTTDMTIKK
jgi:hypothetical protein